MFRNVDAPGNKLNRRGVKAMQRVDGADERKAAAEAKRQRKADRRSFRPLTVEQLDVLQFGRPLHARPDDVR